MLAETGFVSAHLTIVGQSFRSVGHSDAAAAKEFLAMLCKFLKELQQFATVASCSWYFFKKLCARSQRVRLPLGCMPMDVRINPS